MVLSGWQVATGPSTPATRQLLECWSFEWSSLMVRSMSSSSLRICSSTPSLAKEPCNDYVSWRLQQPPGPGLQEDAVRDLQREAKRRRKARQQRQVFSCV